MAKIKVMEIQDEQGNWLQIFPITHTDAVIGLKTFQDEMREDYYTKEEIEEILQNYQPTIDGGVVVSTTEVISTTAIVDTATNSVSLTGLKSVVEDDDFLVVHYNSTHLIQGIDYNLSSDRSKIVKVSGYWNESNTAGCTFSFDLFKLNTSYENSIDGSWIKDGTISWNKLNSDVQNKILQGGNGSGTGNVVKLQNVVNISQAVNQVNIGIESYEASTDSLFVYRNGLLLTEGQDYEIINNSSIKKLGSGNWNEEPDTCEFVFIVLKSVPKSDDIYGSDYVTKDELDNYATKDDLENIKTDLSSYQKKTDEKLQTADKTVTGAINEVNNGFVIVKESLVNALIANGIECSINDDWFVLFDLLIKNSNINNGDEEKPDTDLVVGQWNALKPIGLGRSAISVCAYDGKVYCIGGITKDKTLSNVVNRYDPSTDTWETLTPFPFGMFGASCIVSNNRIYVFGGMTEYESNRSAPLYYYYDLEGDAPWQYGLLPGASSYYTVMPHSAFYDANTDHVYMLTYDDDSNFAIKRSFVDSNYELLGDHYNDFPSFYIGSANCYHNSRIYSIGGYREYLDSELEMYKSLHVFDIASNTVMKLSDFPVEIIGACAEVYNEHIYVFGGIYRDTSVSTSLAPNEDMYVYDIANDSWSKFEGKGYTPRAYAGSCIIDNIIYIIGGAKNQYGDINQYFAAVNEVTNVNEAFVIETKTNI